MTQPAPRIPRGAVSLAHSAAEMYRRGFRVFFYLVCRDDRLPSGKRMRAGSPGPRRATSRIWGRPGSVLTPDDFRKVFRATRYTMWQNYHYGRDAWWYITPPSTEDATSKYDAVLDEYAYTGDGSPQWEGMTLRLPR